MKKETFSVLLSTYSLLGCPWIVRSDDLFQYDYNYGEFFPPAEGVLWEDWWNAALTWKEKAMNAIDYDDEAYLMPRLDWAKRAIVAPQAMMHDTYLYDANTSSFTVSKFLDDLNTRYGGINSVLLWYPYPNLGCDDRNQFDFFKSLPGGLEGIYHLVKDFHEQGISVLFPYNPWDQGTRDEGKPDEESIAELFSIVRADGVNLDTMCPNYGSSNLFWNASLAVHHPLGFQPEWNIDWSNISNGSFQDIMNEVLSWAEHVENYNYYSFPTISLSELYEPRHQTQWVDRWLINKTNIMHNAYLSGGSYVSWENIWGIWNGHAPRYAESLRRWGRIANDLMIKPKLNSERMFYPFVPAGQQLGIYACLYQGSFPELLSISYFWPFVNRENIEYSNVPIMNVPYFEGYDYIDIYHGSVLQGQIDDENNISFSINVEPLGYGGLFAVNASEPLPSYIKLLMNDMALMTQTSLTDYSENITILTQQIKSIEKTSNIFTSCPNGMIEIPSTNKYNFYSIGTMIEGSGRPGVGSQLPWEDEPSLDHSQLLSISKFCIDRYLVTNLQYSEFLESSGYVPNDLTNFLRDWTMVNNTDFNQNSERAILEWIYPLGSEDVPVSWVDLNDVRAYCDWRNCRLPNEWEWQYAAQGDQENYTYPWGYDWSDGEFVPIPDQGRSMRGADNTSAHPQGASLFGVEDLIGNLHQWTNEYTDDHTRSAITKGGSYYQPQGQYDSWTPLGWYFPQPYMVFQYNKFLLLSPGMDRSGGIGFRCVVDLVADDSVI